VLIVFSDVTAEAGTSVSVDIELANSFSIAGAQLNFTIDPQIGVEGSSYFGRGEGFTGGASNVAWLMFAMSGLQVAAYSGDPSDLAVSTLNLDLACELPAGNYSLTPTQTIISDAQGNAVPSASYGGTLTVTPSTTDCDTESNDDSANDNDGAPVLIGFSNATAEAGTSVSLNIELDNSFSIAGAQLNFVFDSQIDVAGTTYFGRAAGVTATFNELGFPMGGASNTAWLMFDITGLQIAAYSGDPSDLAVSALNLDLACELPAGNYSLTPSQSIISDAQGNAVPSASYGGTLTVTPSTTECDTESNDDSAEDNDDTQTTPIRPNPVTPARIEGEMDGVPSTISMFSDDDDSADGNDRTQITARRPKSEKPSREGDSPSRITTATDRGPTYRSVDGNDRTQITARRPKSEKPSREGDSPSRITTATDRGPTYRSVDDNDRTQTTARRPKSEKPSKSALPRKVR